MASPDRFHMVLDRLRASGARITRPRRAILQVFFDHDHPTADQLADAVQVLRPTVNRSTVYRFLDELERIGVVDHVHLGHGPAVYHLAEDAHQHLVCDCCGTVIEIPERTLEPMRSHLRDTFDFEVHIRHFAVVGRCKDCTDE